MTGERGKKGERERGREGERERGREGERERGSEGAKSKIGERKSFANFQNFPFFFFYLASYSFILCTGTGMIEQLNVLLTILICEKDWKRFPRSRSLLFLFFSPSYSQLSHS